MSYLLDKKIQKKKFFKIALGVIVLIFLFYFRAGIWNGFSYVALGIFRPVLILGQGIGEKFNSVNSYFSSKNSLYAENENLKSQLLESQADRANYASVVAENTNLKEILGRKNEKTNMILSAILSKPNQSVYDTLVIDVGTNRDIKVGDMVFALGHSPTGEAFGTVPIGRIAEVHSNSSKVILFSSSGEKTQAIISGKNLFMELVGRGGGNFEMTLPRDLVLQKGDQVVLPGINPYVLAVVETIISDPRDPFTKALLRSSVNIQELKFVEVLQ